MDNIYKAVQLTIDSQNLALSKTPTHVYIANQYVDTNDTPLITAPFIIQKPLENGTGVVDIVSSTIGSIYEVRLLCDAEVLISGYFYMPPMNVNFSELELYTSYPPRTPPVVNEFWQKTENFILEKTNTLLNFVQVFNAVSSMRLSLGYLEELLTTKKSNLVAAINEVYKKYEGVGSLYEKNVAAGAGANGWTDQLIALENGRTQRDKNNEQVSVKDLGAKGDGTTDDTTAINNALTNYRNVFIPAGDYVVTAINVPANTSITTAGFKTRFIQKSGTAQGTRVLNIVGSNVNVLPAISFKGNIATDTNEQNHAVYIQANANTGDISNVNIGDIFAQDIRGDAVYFGQATGATYKLSNVNIGNVSFDNVYRNGVSVVSCNGFSVKSIIGTRVGMQDIDIEANINSGQCKNGNIGFVKGNRIGGIAQSANDYVDNVIFDRVELSYTNYVNSNPEYPSYYKTPVLFRNSRNMKINELIIDGCEGYAIQRVEGDAALANTTLRIGKLTLRNCCNVSNSENGIIKATNVVIDYLELDFNGLSGRSLFYASNDCIVYKADVNFADTCNLFRASSNSFVEKLKTKSTAVGVIFNNSNNCRVSMTTANVDRLFSYSNKCSVLDSDITANILYTSGNDTHAVINSTLNSKYYTFGTLANSYTAPIVFGVMNMWFDSTGKLRAKSSAPTSDTDGEVVGTQGLKATVSYDPPSLSTATQQSTTVTLTGAVVGNAVAVSHSQPLQGTRIWAEVTAANTVTVYHRNDTGATVDVASGNLVVKII